MQLPLQDFAALVRTQAAAVRGGAAGLIDLSVGSVLRAVLEANASVGLWVQWLIVQVLATTRAATSAGADLDTWVGDFGVARLPGTPARGQARLGRGVPGLAASVPVGTLVRTAGPGALTFRVVADPGHPAWTGTGYALAAADTDVTVPILAVLPGAAGNVRPTAIVQMATALPGVDRVTNDGPLIGGVDAEGDAVLRTRFGGFIDSRTRATPGAVAWAVLPSRYTVWAGGAGWAARGPAASPSRASAERKRRRIEKWLGPTYAKSARKMQAPVGACIRAQSPNRGLAPVVSARHFTSG